jgi:hypothetical protein
MFHSNHRKLRDGYNLLPVKISIDNTTDGPDGPDFDYHRKRTERRVDLFWRRVSAMELSCQIDLVYGQNFLPRTKSNPNSAPSKKTIAN